MHAHSRWARGIKTLKVWLLNLAGSTAAMALLAGTVPATAHAQATANATSVNTVALPGELQADLPAARLAGTARLTFWGLDIYNAALWVPPDFQSARYPQHPFALQLTYLRSLDGAAIAKRSIDEMLRQVKFTPERAQAWQTAMAAIFPDVKSGDRITGIHKPGVGASFLLNGKPRGDIADAEFARLFFGIWLSDATSEPAMRKALLAQTAP